MSRVVTIHQPEHLPCLGFFAKMAEAELLVSLDCVPFRKNHVQNRNRILGHDGAPAWLTVPVRLDDHQRGRIADVAIAEDGKWRRRYLRTLAQRYGRHPYFHALFAAVAGAIEAPGRSLAALNHELIRVLARRLGIATPVVRASDVGGEGTRSRLLADICQRVGADVYLSDPSGREYLELDAFGDAGVEVRFHDYEHPVYEQRGSAAFVPHLSVVDLLFNCGSDAAAIVRSGSCVSARAADGVNAGRRAAR